jgi:hypothetical protein
VAKSRIALRLTSDHGSSIYLYHAEISQLMLEFHKFLRLYSIKYRVTDVCVT